MRTITAIEPQKRHPERVNVYLDGSFGFGASLLMVSQRHLTAGVELSAADIESLRRDDDAERAYSSALRFLSQRPRSRREMEDYFRRKKFDDEVASAVIERLGQNGFVDDRDFSHFWVENRQTFRPRGTRALRFELRQKGVESEVIDEALEAITNEEEIAYAAGQKKMHSLQGFDDQEFLKKMLSFLQRRGFGYEAARPAAKRLLEERGKGALLDGGMQ